MIDYFQEGINAYHAKKHKPPKGLDKDQLEEWNKGWNQEFYRGAPR